MGDNLLGAIYAFADHLAEEANTTSSRDTGPDTAGFGAQSPRPGSGVTDRAVYFDILVGGDW